MGQKTETGVKTGKKPKLHDAPQITERQIQKIFGVQHKSLRGRGLTPTNGKYDLAVFYEATSDLIFTKLDKIHGADPAGINLKELRAQKTFEEVRKLKIENGIKEGTLVYADDVAQTYDRGLRAMCDVLDAMPSRLKMQNPDISSSLLDQINQELIKSRNMAADRVSEMADEDFQATE